MPSLLCGGIWRGIKALNSSEQELLNWCIPVPNLSNWHFFHRFGVPPYQEASLARMFFFFLSYMFSQWKYLLRFTIIECNRPFEMDFLPSDCLSIEARFHVETCSPLLSSDVELFMEFCSIFFNACHAAFCPVCLFLTKFCVGDLS
eukprot:TRINITY_DN10477_c1_g2_i1.p1 TRINITY_DN10477_c1_g2~~TRINITY_DN10477_c1_g2_i1.p1  ORF type:complete len:146 (-),score=11.58 TRINITY_DN10477_c1_g2_i1:49-486(-)